MDDLLNHPAIQSAGLPLLISAVWMYSLKKWPLWAGLGGLVAFLITVGMVVGFEIIPLSSTKKIILLAVFSTLCGFLYDWYRDRIIFQPIITTIILIVLSVMALTWVLWPVLNTVDWLTAALFVYVAWSVAMVQGLQNNFEQLSVSLVALGTGTSIVCILGASALYGQLATPFSVAVGVWLLYYLWHLCGEKFPAGLYLPAVLVTAVLASSAVVYASLTPLTLLFLGLIPIVVRIPVKFASSSWLRISIKAVYAFIPVSFAIWYIFQNTVEDAYYG